jgi:hypothetical protein
VGAHAGACVAVARAGPTGTVCGIVQKTPGGAAGRGKSRAQGSKPERRGGGAQSMSDGPRVGAKLERVTAEADGVAGARKAWPRGAAGRGKRGAQGSKRGRRGGGAQSMSDGPRVGAKAQRVAAEAGGVAVSVAFERWGRRGEVITLAYQKT